MVAELRRSQLGGLGGLRRSKSTGGVTSSRADPRSWGLGPARGFGREPVGAVQPQQPEKGGFGETRPMRSDAERVEQMVKSQSAAALGRPAASSFPSFPSFKDKPQAKGLANVGYALPKPLQKGSAVLQKGLANAGYAPKAKGSEVDRLQNLYGAMPGAGAPEPEPVASGVSCVPATTSLDRVFQSVCSDIMNFNFRPYERPVHWPLSKGKIVVAAGAPARALRVGR